jgi:AcrR family transcriptional regulator
VDHDARRREVVDAAARLVARDGRAALTVRSVAAEVGCSTTVVSHYFADVTDLLHQTYAHAADRARRRVEAVLAVDPSDVVGLAEALLPLDEARRDDWRVWLAFWSEALSAPAFAAEQRARARSTVDRFERCLRLRRATGRLDPDVDVRDAAHRLGALVPGIAAEAVFDPESWGPRRQRAVLRGELALIGALDAGEAPARRRFTRTG